MMASSSPTAPTTTPPPALPQADAAPNRADRVIFGLLLLVGLGARLYYAGATHLNPDEAMHVNGALQPTWAQVIATAWEHSHPPLLFVVLHGWTRLFDSVIAVRLPMVLADVLMLGLLASWWKQRWGRTAALVTLALLSVSPAAIAVGSEVRQMALALCFVVAALPAFERLVERDAAAWSVVYSLCLAIAISAHFGAAFLLATLGFYAIARLRQAGVSRSTWLAWGLGQVVVLAWSLVLYTSNRASQGFFFHREYLMPLLYDSSRDSVGVYVGSHAWAAFVHLGGAAWVALLLIAAGGAGLLAVITDRRGRAIDLMWLALPLLMGIVGGLTRQMPFGGSRHVAYLLPAVACAVGIGVARWLPRRAVVPAVVLFAAVMLLSTAPANRPDSLPPAGLERALHWIDHEAKPGTTLIVDRQTHEILRYAWREREVAWVDLGGGLREWRWPDLRVIELHETWLLQPMRWWQDIAPVLAAHGIRSEATWVMTAGWPRRLQFPYARPGHVVRRFRQAGTFRMFEMRSPAPSDAPN